MPGTRKRPAAATPELPAGLPVETLLLDTLDLSRLLPLTETLLRRLEDYHRYGPSEWTGWLLAALAVENELTRLGMPGKPVDLLHISGPAGTAQATRRLREWLLSLRGPDVDGWGERAPAWTTPPNGTTRLPDMTGQLTTLREIVKDLRASAAPPCILAHGNRQYSIGDYGPVMLTDTEDLVLAAYLGDGKNLLPLTTMDKPELRRRSVEHAPRVLRALCGKYDGRLAPAIHCPPGKKKGQGGYTVHIKPAD
jgi:hypothetical protein